MSYALNPSVRYAQLDAELVGALHDINLKWVVVGDRLRKIKSEELYKHGGFATWGEYCAAKTDWSKRHVDSLISDAESRERLLEFMTSKNGNPVPIPECLPQKTMREIAKSGPVAEQVQVIKAALKSDGKLTQNTVKTAREKRAKARVVETAPNLPMHVETTSTILTPSCCPTCGQPWDKSQS